MSGSYQYEAVPQEDNADEVNVKQSVEEIREEQLQKEESNRVAQINQSLKDEKVQRQLRIRSDFEKLLMDLQDLRLYLYSLRPNQHQKIEELLLSVESALLNAIERPTYENLAIFVRSLTGLVTVESRRLNVDIFEMQFTYSQLQISQPNPAVTFINNAKIATYTMLEFAERNSGAINDFRARLECHEEIVIAFSPEEYELFVNRLSRILLTLLQGNATLTRSEILQRLNKDQAFSASSKIYLGEAANEMYEVMSDYFAGIYQKPLALMPSAEENRGSEEQNLAQPEVDLVQMRERLLSVPLEHKPPLTTFFNEPKKPMVVEGDDDDILAKLMNSLVTWRGLQSGFNNEKQLIRIKTALFELRSDHTNSRALSSVIAGLRDLPLDYVIPESAFDRLQSLQTAQNILRQLENYLWRGGHWYSISGGVLQRVRMSVSQWRTNIAAIAAEGESFSRDALTNGFLQKFHNIVDEGDESKGSLQEKIRHLMQLYIAVYKFILHPTFVNQQAFVDRVKESNQTVDAFVRDGTFSTHSAYVDLIHDVNVITPQSNYVDLIHDVNVIMPQSNASHVSDGLRPPTDEVDVNAVKALGNVPEL